VPLRLVRREDTGTAPRRVGILLTVLLAACLGVARPATAQEQQAEAQPNREAGQAVAVGTFSAAPGGACFQCHGSAGEGDATAGFPRLAGQAYSYLFKSLQDYASGARQNDIMSPIAEALTEQQMRDVAAYYAGLHDTGYVVRPAPPAPQLQYGAALAAVGSAELGIQGCVNCHGPEGSGLAPNYPYLAGQHQTYLEMQLRAWQEGTRSGDMLGVMADIALRMSEKEIAAVSAYYASLPPAVMETTEEAQ
jgi:cytochrome c553